MKEHNFWISRVLCRLGESPEEMVWAGADPTGGDLSYSALRAFLFLRGADFPTAHCHRLSVFAAFESSLFVCFFLFCLFGQERRRATHIQTLQVAQGWSSDSFPCKVLQGRAWLRADIISHTFRQTNKQRRSFTRTHDKRANREAAGSEELTTKGFCSHTARLALNLEESRTSPWS